MGSVSSSCAAAVASPWVKRVIISVSITPGHTAFTRMPWGAYSRAAVFVRPRMPCFDAE